MHETPSNPLFVFKNFVYLSFSTLILYYVFQFISHDRHASDLVDAHPSYSNNLNDITPIDSNNNVLPLIKELTFCECHSFYGRNHFSVKEEDSTLFSTQRLKNVVQEFEGAVVAHEYRGSIENELIVVLPYLYYLHKNDKLIVTCSCGNMSPFYFFSPNHITVEGCSRNASYDKTITSYNYKSSISHSPPSNSWLPPPLKSSFCGCPPLWTELVSESSLVILTNAFVKEWFGPNLKHRNPDFLMNVTSLFLERGFHVVYDRGNAEEKDLQKGSRERKEVSKLSRKFRSWKRFAFMHEIAKQHSNFTFDEVKVRLMSKSRCFVSFQEQSSILSSYFGGWNLIFAKHFSKKLRMFFKHSYRLSGARVDFSDSALEFEELVVNMASSRQCVMHF